MRVRDRRLLSAKSVTCRSRARSRTFGSNMQYSFRVNLRNASSARPHLYKIHQRKTDRITRAFETMDSVQSSPDLVISCELESVSDPDTCFRGCPTDVQRDYLSRLGETSIVFCCYCTCYWSGFTHPCRLINGLLVGVLATVCLHHVN